MTVTLCVDDPVMQITSSYTLQQMSQEISEAVCSEFVGRMLMQ